MKNTDHHKAWEANDQVLVVFSGKSTYVSGTWYSNPHIASTWNYMSVHARGSIRFLDHEGLVDMLRMTTLYFEDQNTESTTVYDNLPQEFKDRVMGAIVAFEIEVEQMDAIFKLSQDRDKESFENIIRHLKTRGHDAEVIAGEMGKRKDKIFSLH